MTKALEQFKMFLASLMRPHPARDWFTALIITLVLSLGAVAFASYLFWGIRGGGIIKIPQATVAPSPAVSRAELESVLAFYRARRLNFETHNLRVPPLVDLQ